MYACTLQHRSLVTKGRATYFSPCKHGAVGGDGEGRGMGGGGGPALSSTESQKPKSHGLLYRTGQSLSGSVRLERSVGGTQGPNSS